MTVVANEVTEETRARPWGPPGHHKGLGFNFKLAGGLEFPASRNERNTFLLFKLLRPWYFVMAA